MALIISGDIHLHPHSAWSSIKDGFNTRLLHGWAAIKEISDRAGPGGNIIILGDWFEDRRNIPISAMEMTRRWLDMCHAQRQIIWILAGNHDQEWRNGEVNSLGLLERDNVCVIDQPKTVQSRSYGVSMDFVPFHPDSSVTLQQILDIRASYEAEPGTTRLLLLHAEFYGASMDSGDLCGRGLKPADMPDGYSMIISGHFHAPQKLGKVHYVGSPYQISAGEMGNQNRLFVMSNGRIESEPITVCPRFRRVSMAEAQTLGESAKNDFLIIECADQKELSTATTLFSNCKTKLARPIAQRVSYTSGDTVDIIAKWLKARDRERLIPQALELYKS